MSLAFQTPLDLQSRRSLDDDEALIVDLDGYEGPLDVLLVLARAQKVDLLKISVARLAEQYLDFLRQARRRRIVVAADYLVMAAWLVFLKSRLLLPAPSKVSDATATPEDAARALAFRLARLEAMRQAAEALEAGSVLHRDVFTRGDPTAIRITPSGRLEESLFDLMAAYVDQRRRQSERCYAPPAAVAYRLDEARARVRALLPALGRWSALSRIAPPGADGGPDRASCLASTLAASLELVREGQLEARQLTDFAEIYLRGRAAKHGRQAA
ncbi:MAG TPA: ScpA family protein [Caulobacteraceae bacterium]|jgi:segregation and condensation protein A